MADKKKDEKEAAPTAPGAARVGEHQPTAERAAELAEQGGDPREAPEVSPKDTPEDIAEEAARINADGGTEQHRGMLPTPGGPMPVSAFVAGDRERAAELLKQRNDQVKEEGPQRRALDEATLDRMSGPELRAYAEQEGWGQEAPPSGRRRLREFVRRKQRSEAPSGRKAEKAEKD